MSKNECRFYVYAYLRSKDSDRGKKGSPYYIGKGSKFRAYTRTQRTCPAPKSDEYIVFIQEGLTEKEAFRLECFCIGLYGRIDIGTGCLWNRTDGGEGASGFIRTPEMLRKQSLAHKGRRVSQSTRLKMAKAKRGRRHSQPTREKMSQSASGANNAFYGRKHSEESRRRMTESHIGSRHSEETRRKMSEIKKGQKHTQEAKDKMSISRAKYEYLVRLEDGQMITTVSLSRLAKTHHLPRWALYKSLEKNGVACKGISVVIFRSL